MLTKHLLRLRMMPERLSFAPSCQAAHPLPFQVDRREHPSHIAPHGIDGRFFDYAQNDMRRNHLALHVSVIRWPVLSS